MLVQQKIQAGFAVALAFLLLTGASAWWSVHEDAEAFRWVEHTERVLDAFQDTQTAVLVTQTEMHGFLISGDETMLPAYASGIAAIQKSFAEAKQLTQDNPRQQRRLAAFALLLQKKTSFENEAIRLRRSGDIAGAAQFAAAEPGRQTRHEIRKLLDEGEAEENQIRQQHADAAQTAFQVTTALVVFGSLLALGLVGLAGVAVRRDFAKRRQAEAERDRFFDLALDVFGIAKTDGYFKRINPAFATTLGWSAEEILARPFMEFVHPDDRPATLREVEKLAAGQPTLRFENRYQCKDGSWKTLSWRAVAQPDGTIYCTGRDMTELKLAEAARRHSEESLAITLHSIGDAVLATDAGGRITRMNPIAEKLTGWPAAEALGRPVADVFHIINEETRSPAVLPVDQVLASGEIHGLANHTVIIARDGTERPIADSAAPIRDQDGPVLGVVLVFRDVTEEKQEEREIRRFNQELEKLVSQRAAALRESEERLNLAIQVAALGMWDMNLQTGAAQWNDAVFEQLGYPPAPAGTATVEMWDARVLPADRPRVREELEQARRTRSKVESEHRLVRADNGEIRWISVSGMFSFNEAGEATRLLGVSCDITGRKAAEQKLQAAHHRASVLARLGRKLAEALTPKTAALAILEAADELLNWDSSWLRIWNAEQQQWKDIIAFDLMDGERREVATNPAGMLKPSPLIRRAMDEAQLLLRDGEADETHPITVFGNGRRSRSLMFAPIRAAGRLTGMLSIQSYQPQAYDPAALELFQTLADHCAGALARIQAASELGATEERFRLVWESTADGMRLTDGAGRIVAVNNAFCRLMGRTRNEMAGQVISSLYAAPDHARILARHQEWFAQHTVPAYLAEPTTLWDGRMLWLDVSNGFIETDPARPLLLSVFRDVTERKKAEHQALRSQRLEGIGTLAGGIAHDLNNALAPILMSGELLRMIYPGESQLLDTIENSAKRAAGMVRQLLTFAKGAEGERTVIHPGHLVEEMKQLMEGSFPKNLELVVKCDPELPAVLGNATQLHQVLLNFCVNARDAMPHGGTLTLEAQRVAVDAVFASSVPDAKPGKYLVLRVRDTGTGIPPEILDRIFDPFFTTKGPDKGTGLGLSTVMGIVKGHGGFLQVYSQPGKGSTFAAYLPADQTGGDTEHRATMAVEFHGQGETILFVDDEFALRDVARAVLRHLNFQPLTATDGADGLIQAAQHRTALRAIITDLHMPHMDGLAFVRALRRILPDIPIAVATGRMEDALAGELKTLGVTCRLDKPFTEAQLAAALKNLLAPKSPPANNG